MAKKTKKKRKKSLGGRTPGATDVVNEELVEFVSHCLALGQRIWTVKKHVKEWIQEHHPDREEPVNSTIEKAVTKGRLFLAEKVAGTIDTWRDDSHRFYEEIITDPHSTNGERLKARALLDELRGTSSKYTGMGAGTQSPEAKAARAREALAEMDDLHTAAPPAVVTEPRKKPRRK